MLRGQAGDVVLVDLMGRGVVGCDEVEDGGWGSDPIRRVAL